MTTACIAEPAVVTDPDLLALEFEAIIAANYPRSADRVRRRPPTVRRAPATRVAPRGRGPRTQRVAHQRIRIDDRRPQARQRSPPSRVPAVSTVW